MNARRDEGVFKARQRSGKRQEVLIVQDFLDVPREYSLCCYLKKDEKIP